MMMRRVMLLLLCVSAIALRAQAQVTTFLTDEGQVVNNATLGVSIVFPKGWAIIAAKEQCGVNAICPLENAKDTFQEVLSLMWNDAPANLSDDEVIKGIIGDMKTAFPGCTILGTYSGTIAGVPTTSVVTSLMSADNPPQPRKMVSFFLVKNRVAYNVMCMSTPDDYDKYKAAFQACAKSLQFSLRQPPPPPPPVRTTWKDEGFSIMGPQGWAVKEAAWPKLPGKVVSFIRPTTGPTDPVSEMLFVYTDPFTTPPTLEKYFQDQRALLQKSVMGYKELAAGSLTVNDHPGKFVQYTGKNYGTLLAMLRCVIMDDKRAFVLTCTSTPENYAKYKDLYQQAIMSLEVLK